MNGVNHTGDDNGNLLSDGVDTYTYDYANRLTAALGLTSTVSFSYNGDGLLAARSHNGQASSYTWDMVAGLPQMLGDGNSLVIPGLGEWDGASWEYYLPDALGSVRQLADPQGHVLQGYSYSPFGEVLSAQGLQTSLLRYAGEHWDGDAGLLYLRARWYDPATGRFLSRDPFPGFPVLPQSQNPYAYSLNNPINFTDPSGEFTPDYIWDFAMVLLDLGFWGYDYYYYTVLNPCANPWEREAAYALDRTALALDAALFLVPIAPGGFGLLARLTGRGTLAFASTGVRVPAILRVGQGVIKGSQLGVHFFQSNGGGRTSHGESRHTEGNRPTSQAFQDKAKPVEVYIDNDTGNKIYIGPKGRTHVFTPEGQHHTSFRTTRRNRIERVLSGKWTQIK